jgi:hypothetical protein
MLGTSRTSDLEQLLVRARDAHGDGLGLVFDRVDGPRELLDALGGAQ